MPRMRHIAVVLSLLGVCAASLIAAGAWAPSTAAVTWLALVGLVIATVGVASMWPGLELFGRVVTRGPTSPARVALTFDDGPDPASTPALLDALRARGERATFFVLADRVQAHPELARRIATEQELALHGLVHSARLTWLSQHRGAQELERAISVVERVTGQRPRYFRPPFGAVSPRLFDAVRATGLQTIWCSIRPRDGLLGSRKRTLSACKRAKAGDIVLMHEGQRPAKTCIDEVLDEWRQRGLRAVSVGELLRSPAERTTETAD